MADAISLGSSVLAFITIAPQLSKVSVIFYGSLHDAPDEVKRVHTRLRDLGFALDSIDRIRKIHHDFDEDC